mmetsp:Transcript_15101/g.17372  ORF Transcript_15101/g.17372 Transcript_15101/m.17372 type:complete len:92 (+) Transcript_15101:470-745(+)
MNELNESKNVNCRKNAHNPDEHYLILEYQRKLAKIKEMQAIVLNKTNAHQQILYNHHCKYMTQYRNAGDVDNIKDKRDNIDKYIEQLPKDP